MPSGCTSLAAGVFWNNVRWSVGADCQIWRRRIEAHARLSRVCGRGPAGLKRSCAAIIAVATTSPALQSSMTLDRTITIHVGVVLTPALAG